MTERDSGQSESSAGEFERITPVRITPGAPTQASPPKPQKQSISAMIVWLVLGLLVLLAAGVFLWLPRHTATPVAAREPTASTPPAAAQGPATTPAADADALLDAREQAQNLATELKQKREQLQRKHVQRWAAKAFADNSALAEQAQKKFDGHDYPAATEDYRTALAQAEALFERADEVLADALARGDNAFAAHESAAAVEAYDLALAVDPDNAQAKKGLHRAQSLDSVLEKMQAGDAYEQAGDLAAARDDYQAALNLDDEYAAAKQALARVRGQLGARAFEQQMSRGLAALERGDFSAAQVAFQAAKKLRPADASAADGLGQANAGLQQQAIARHRDQAQVQAQQENWQQALDEYQAALKLDSSLAFANAGQAHARERLELSNQLQYHLDHPQRLADGTVQGSVEALLTRARAVTESAPKLEAQVNKLSKTLSAMRTPVPVQLRSDKQTEVLVYHVGDLGKFDSISLELTPGDYTVVGRCPGYRDVRLTIKVNADQSQVGPIDIRCKEKI